MRNIHKGFGEKGKPVALSPAITQIRMGGRGIGDLGGKEIGGGGSEVRRGEGNIEVGSVLDGEGMEREMG